MDEGLRITARSGGHCYEGFVTDQAGVIIDLSPMNGVYRDPALENAYCLEGGCTLWDVYTQLYREYGVTIPAGSCYSVGVGGHVCGGGYGLLSRKLGLVVDWLAAVEVVCVDENGLASAVLALPDHPDPDVQALYWAHTGGGGGNFGIVTRFWFSPNLPPAPSTAALSSRAWNWPMPYDEFAAIVTNFGNFFAAHSSPDDPYADLFSLLALTASNSPQIVMTTQFVGSDYTLLNDFLKAMGANTPTMVPQSAPVGHHLWVPHSAQYRVMPWLQATQTLNGSGPNRRGKYKSAYMNQPFPPGQIETIYAALTDPAPSHPAALLQVDSYGCRVNAVAPSATAVAQRSSMLKLQYQIYWNDPADDAENLSWMRDFYTGVYADTGGEPVSNGLTDGCFVNYCDTDLRNWSSLYYKENYPLLREVKGAWDPLNVFHHAQSIELP